jgi:hypothetical protein
MEMFLMAACMSLLGVAAAALAFAAATRGEHEPADAGALPQALPTPAPPRFFVPASDVLPPRPRVPIEALLLQIERHVRLEQAAAESFLDSPTSASLHTPTVSPLVH